jgi:hypothetical protein
VRVFRLARGKEVDGVCRRRVDRVLEGGLEAVAEVEHELCVGDRTDVTAGELEVVRLDTRRGQVADVDPVPTDLLGGEGQWVESGDDVRSLPYLSCRRSRRASPPR